MTMPTSGNPAAPPAETKPVQPVSTVEAHLNAPREPDRLEIANKAKDQAIDALRRSVQTFEQSVQQKDDVIAQQQQIIEQQRENLRAANEHLASSLGAPDPQPQQQPASPASVPPNSASEIARIVDGVLAQRLTPFAEKVVSLEGNQERVTYERAYGVQLTEAQNEYIKGVRKAYPGMPYPQAVLHLTPELAIQPGQKVINQVTEPKPQEPGPVPSPQPLKPQVIDRPPSLVRVPPPATAPGGRAPDQPKARSENSHTIGEIAKSMENATAKGALRDRDEMGARAIQALMQDKDGNPIFPELRT